MKTKAWAWQLEEGGGLANAGSYIGPAMFWMKRDANGYFVNVRGKPVKVEIRVGESPDLRRIASALNLEPEMGKDWASEAQILRRIRELQKDREEAWKAKRKGR